MKKTLLIGKSRYLGYVLIALQGLLLTLLAAFFVNGSYMQAWENYPSGNADNIYLSGVSDDRQTATGRYLTNCADEMELFIVRRDISLNNGGMNGSLIFGVYGNYGLPDASMSFMYQSILDSDNLALLLTSKNTDSTLGVETGSAGSLGDIPSFRFQNSIVVKQLPQLISSSETINGSYSIVGLNEQNRQSFLAGLSEVSGISIDKLTQQGAGMAADNSLVRDMLLIFLCAQVFLSSVFYLVIAVKSLTKEGKLVLLGWSQKAFVKETLGVFVKTAVAFIPPLILAGWILSGWSAFSINLMGYLFAGCIVNIFLLMIELCFSAFILLSIKALDAIRGRIPKKPLYVLGIMAYLLVSIGTVCFGSYFDTPLRKIDENAKISEQWASVSDYALLRDLSVGQDSESIRGQSNKLNTDLYRWYSSIADQSDVYIIHTEYFGEDVISGWRDNKVYTGIPENPFWYFTVSPNYLTELGITTNGNALTSAKDGARLYLLPSTLSESEQAQMKEYLKHSSTKSLSEGDIQTTFTKEQNFEFITYEPSKELFTWATSSDNDMTVKAPVIYVCTPENMRYFEDESLRTTGLAGYIKFSSLNAAEQYTQPAMWEQFALSDNAPVFSEVREYIDGLQKNLWTTILGYGLAVVVLIVILIGLLITLVSIFRIANQEKLNVKKFFGFDFWSLYRIPMSLLLLAVFIQLAVVLLLQSKFGLALVCFAALLQLIVFGKSITKNELKRLLTAFKGE